MFRFPKLARDLAHLQSISLVLLAIAGFILFAGCEPKLEKPMASSQTSTTQSSTSPAGGGHAHVHDHGEEGEHGGHMVHLEPSEEHAEWSHDDEKGTVTVYLEELVAGGAKVDSVRIDLEVTGNPKKSYAFESSSDEHKIADSVFSIKSPELVTAIGVGEGVEATLVVVLDGKEQTSKLEHDHGHDHDH